MISWTVQKNNALPLIPGQNRQNLYLIQMRKHNMKNKMQRLNFRWYRVPTYFLQVYRKATGWEEYRKAPINHFKCHLSSISQVY